MRKPAPPQGGGRAAGGSAGSRGPLRKRDRTRLTAQPIPCVVLPPFRRCERSHDRHSTCRQGERQDTGRDNEVHAGLLRPSLPQAEPPEGLPHRSGRRRCTVASTPQGPDLATRSVTSAEDHPRDALDHQGVPWCQGALGRVAQRPRRRDPRDLRRERRGKSTLMKVLSGVYPYGTYSGEIVYEGEEVRFKDIKQSEQAASSSSTRSSRSSRNCRSPRTCSSATSRASSASSTGPAPSSAHRTCSPASASTRTPTRRSRTSASASSSSWRSRRPSTRTSSCSSSTSPPRP